MGHTLGQLGEKCLGMPRGANARTAGSAPKIKLPRDIQPHESIDSSQGLPPPWPAIAIWHVVCRHLTSLRRPRLLPRWTYRCVQGCHNASTPSNWTQPGLNHHPPPAAAACHRLVQGVLRQKDAELEQRAALLMKTKVKGEGGSSCYSGPNGSSSPMSPLSSHLTPARLLLNSTAERH